MKKESKKQYLLKIENGNIKEEQGSFFKAIPFIIENENQKIDVLFTHKNHEVIYTLTHNNTPIAELEFPTYLPNIDPAKLNTSLKHIKNPLFIPAALLHLSVAKSKPFADYLKQQEPCSFTVSQSFPTF